MSSQVKVEVPSMLRHRSGGAAELALAADTVRAALAEIEQRQPSLHASVCDETGKVRPHVNLFVNADNIRDRAGLDTPLAPGDVVTILPAVSGG